MNIRISVRLFLLCVWFSGGFLMGMTAEPTVSASIISPEADRKEGWRVDMKCNAKNLNPDHIVEWRTEDPEMTLRWGNMTLTTNPRFRFETSQPYDGEITQDFTINNLRRYDTGEYTCNVRQPIPSGGSHVVASSQVQMSVLYFPKESFPICSPNGPSTESNGTQLNMRCSSEYGNPAVTMNVSQLSTNFNKLKYSWITTTDDYTLFSATNLTVGAGDSYVTFQCIIASAGFPGMNRSCTIGPIQITQATNPRVEPSTTSEISPLESSTTTPNKETVPLTAIIAGASAGGVTTLIFLFILVIICRRQCVCNSGRKQPAASHTQTANSSDTVFTTDQTTHSQFNIYADSNDETQVGPAVTNIYHDPDDIPATASTQPALSLHYDSISITRGEEGSIPLYFTPPQRGATASTRLDAREKISHQSTEQRYTNPMFNSQYSDINPELSKDTLKRTAVVPPMQGTPVKPRPYKSTSPRASNITYESTPDRQDHRMSSQTERAPSSNGGQLLPPTDITLV